jgi:hypothetical protein
MAIVDAATIAQQLESRCGMRFSALENFLKLGERLPFLFLGRAMPTGSATLLQLKQSLRSLRTFLTPT